MAIGGQSQKQVLDQYTLTVRKETVGKACLAGLEGYLHLCCGFGVLRDILQLMSRLLSCVGRN